tara:strand:+ start:143 stop:322 length:180 start_codon:yes stop_codon:yes gene_type:complete
MPKSKHHRKKKAWSKVLKEKNKRKAIAKYNASPKRDEERRKNVVLNINSTYQNEQNNNI